MDGRIGEMERLGRMIFEADSVSAHASDVVVAAGIPRHNPRIRGWLALPLQGGGWDIPFVETMGDGWGVAHRVRVSAGEYSLESQANPRPATPDEAGMFQARQTALAQVGRLCGGSPNPVVLPASLIGRQGWLVYILAATDDPHVRIVAGHRKFLVSADGRVILEEIPLSKGCMAMDDRDARLMDHPRRKNREMSLSSVSDPSATMPSR